MINRIKSSTVQERTLNDVKPNDLIKAGKQTLGVVDVLPNSFSFFINGKERDGILKWVSKRDAFNAGWELILPFAPLSFEEELKRCQNFYGGFRKGFKPDKELIKLLKHKNEEGN